MARRIRLKEEKAQEQNKNQAAAAAAGGANMLTQNQLAQIQAQAFLQAQQQGKLTPGNVAGQQMLTLQQ